MTAPLLSECALEQLSKIQAKLLPIKPVSGSSWNVGGLAIVNAEIVNTTGAPLRNVAVETMIYGIGAVYQGFMTWDGNGAMVGDLEPGETWTGTVAFLKGTAANSFPLLLNISAEVIPHASIWPSWTTYTVQPQA